MKQIVSTIIFIALFATEIFSKQPAENRIDKQSGCLSDVAVEEIYVCDSTLRSGNSYYYKNKSEAKPIDSRSITEASSWSKNPTNNKSGMTNIVLLLIIGGIVYLLPAFIAKSVSHSKMAGIAVLNIFLGWTIVGWVISLVWAVSDKPQKGAQLWQADHSNEANHTSVNAIKGELEQLLELFKRGLITDEEYAAKKRKLLGL